MLVFNSSPVGARELGLGLRRDAICRKRSAGLTWMRGAQLPARGTFDCSVRGDGVPGRPGGCDWGVTAGTVSKLCQQGHLVEAVDALGVLVQTDCWISAALFYSVLKKCVVKKDLVVGRRVHAFTVRNGYESDTFLCNHILRMYASHGRSEEAMDVFNRVAEPDAFMWSSMISAHVKQGQDKLAIELYHKMRRSSVKADGHVFVAALQACARGADLENGQQVHSDVLASGFGADLFVCNCLLDMYAKCGSMAGAQRVFDGLGQKDVVTWTALIAGYSQQGLGQEAIDVYTAMQEEGLAAPNSVTFVCLLQACASVGTGALEKGRQIHSQIREQGLQADVVVGCGLVNMYAKCGSLEDAQRVFDGLGQKDVVTWTALIAGYSQQGRGQKALELYSAMEKGGIAVPDSVTFVSLLQACASVGVPALEKGKQLHAQIQELGYKVDDVVGCSLVYMYAKCGSLGDARDVFARLSQKNVVTWTALISGYAKCGSLEDAQALFDRLGEKNVVTWNAMIGEYAQQGMGQEAIRLYRAMQDEGLVAPDSVTFVCLLQACANVAALDLGRHLHAQIEEQGLQSDDLVALSLINMYAKSGSTVEAQHVFEALPKRDDVAWNTLIAGHTRQGDSEVVFDLFRRMRGDGIQPDGITFLSLLTVCSHAGLVIRGREYFSVMSRHYGITPTVEHYTCMVDLLGRAGQLEEALAFVRTMPVLPTAVVWHTLLGASRKWGNVQVGVDAFNEAVKLDKNDAAAYVLMCNIYIDGQMWEQAQEIQARRERIGAWKPPGQSWWTDNDGLVHSFLVGEKQHSEIDAIYARLKQLFLQLKKVEYVPHMPRHTISNNESKVLCVS